MMSVDLGEVCVFEPQREIHEEFSNLCGRLVGQISGHTHNRPVSGVTHER